MWRFIVPGADVQRRNRKGRTCLMLAARSDHVEVECDLLA
jgi:hypothetical protein